MCVTLNQSISLTLNPKLTFYCCCYICIFSHFLVLKHMSEAELSTLKIEQYDKGLCRIHIEDTLGSIPPCTSKWSHSLLGKVCLVGGQSNANINGFILHTLFVLIGGVNNVGVNRVGSEFIWLVLWREWFFI